MFGRVWNLTVGPYIQSVPGTTKGMRGTRMKSPRNLDRAERPHVVSSPNRDFWKNLAGSLIGVVIGGFISVAATYFASQWTADNQRKQFLIERSQSFSEYMALQYLPRSGDVPQECQVRLQECRQLRQSAFQIYLFLPNNAQRDIVKSYGPKAVEATSSVSGQNLPPEVAAIDNALKDVREWVTGEKVSDFNFILPCAVWKVEERMCRKP
jgi:hypothetical protein